MINQNSVNPKARVDVPWAMYGVVRFRGENGTVVGVFRSEELARRALENHGLCENILYGIFKYVRDNTFDGGPGPI